MKYCPTHPLCCTRGHDAPVAITRVFRAMTLRRRINVDGPPYGAPVGYSILRTAPIIIHRVYDAADDLLAVYVRHHTQVGDNLFVHAGLRPQHLRGADDVAEAEEVMESMNTATASWLRGTNKEIPKFMFGEDGPVWTRVYSRPDSRDMDEATRAELEEVNEHDRGNASVVRVSGLGSRRSVCCCMSARMRALAPVAILRHWRRNHVR